MALNRTMVELKLSIKFDDGNIEDLFQFNHCAIKSLMTRTDILLIGKFQFNHCAIKSCIRVGRNKGYIYFNSTIVRLRASVLCN